MTVAAAGGRHGTPSSPSGTQGRISHGHWKRSRESFDLLLYSTLTRTKADSSHNGKTENNETYVHSFIPSSGLLTR